MKLLASHKYKHKTLGYEVEVLGTDQHKGKVLSFKTVRVRGTLGSPNRTVSWRLSTFLSSFEPVGRKLRRRSIWERL